MKSAAAMALAAFLAACGGGSDVAVNTQAAFATPTVAFKDPQSSFELANYSLAGRFSLPVGTGANLLAEEASAVTYNKDTDTLFIVGDGGTSIVQVTKQGVLVDSMILARDATKPRGVYFDDPEGLTYIGGGKFVLAEERNRVFNEFTYTANTTMPANTLTAVEVRAVKLGTTIGNIGIEGLSFDPMTNGFIAVKESGPSGVFQTTVNFAAGTASNGSATATDSINLFTPTLTGLTAINDVFSMANILTTTAPDLSHIMLLSAPDGKIVKMDRTGRIVGTLVVGSAAQNEGMTMDAAGNIYVVSEQGGGSGRPELLVYSPTVSKNSVGVGSNVYVSFSQTILAGTGSIVLSNGAGDVRSIPIGDTRQVKISGNMLMIDPATDLTAGSAYSITYPAGILRDASGNASPAVSSATLLNFTTTSNADTNAPLLTNSSPADNATSAANNRIVLTFNEAVTATVAGNIVITGVTDTRVISVLDATQVTFSGNTINIVPTSNLLSSSTYNMQIAAGVIRDAAGNSYAGITTTTALNFTTAPPAPAAAPSLLIAEMNSNGAGSDFFELYNFGTTAIDLTGWKWDDDSANFADTGVASFPSITLAAGARLIVTNTTEAAFRTAWGLTGVATVTVVATGGPGLGGGDAVVLFDAAGKVVTSFNYRGGATITASDGTVIPVVQAATGVTATFPNHAGLAFGGTAITSAVWDGVSTTAPRYKAAVVGELGAAAQPAAPTAIGSPGL